jgi:hypothetical protein
MYVIIVREINKNIRKYILKENIFLKNMITSFLLIILQIQT